MELYHVLNRGVDGRDLFVDDSDRLRFVHNLFEFNDIEPALTVRNVDLRSPHLRRDRHGDRSPLVDIHAWCLMQNHYHLLLSERSEGALTQFLRKLNIGYAKYFNERQGRKGTLFQGRTKKVLIERDAHLLYILHYIHLNPLDHFPGAEEWRVRGQNQIQDATAALAHLETYRWSSYLDYAGKRNFPSILSMTFFKETLGEESVSPRAFLQEAERDALDAKLFLE